MRAFIDIVRFELKHQLKSPLFLGLLAVFFLLHLLAITSTGMNLGTNNLVYANSVYLVTFTQLVFTLFVLMPILMFVVISIVRDHDYRTAEFFYTCPVSKTAFFLGRFTGSLILAEGVALAGVLGMLAGPFTPLAGTGDVGPFSLAPYLYALFVFSLPNFFIATCFFFAISALTRSAAPALAGVFVFLAFDLWMNTNVSADTMAAFALFDPFGGTAFQAEIRYWTVPELNTQMPVGLLPANRLLWMALGLAALLLALRLFRMDMEPGTSVRPGRLRPQKEPARPRAALVTCRTPVQPVTARQLLAQLRMDLGATLPSPLFGLLVGLVILGTVGEFNNNTARIFSLPLYPLTSNMMGWFRYGLVMQVMIMAVYFSGTLVHRERDCNVHEIIGAMPASDAVMVLSKCLALCLTVSLYLFAAMLTAIAMQLLSGHTNLELDVYLAGIFFFNGVYYYLLCILAVFLQVLSPNKWLGMLLTFVIFIILSAFPALGLEHPLVDFSLPYVIYSDMNGFGHYTLETLSQAIYLGAFCGILLIIAHLAWPRGTNTVIRERLQDARSRLGPAVAVLATTAIAVFAAAGGWIYYNTNILNDFISTREFEALRADYERQYLAWENTPTPSFAHVDFTLDLVPEERRFRVSGSAEMRNNKPAPISAFVLSMDPYLGVDNLAVSSATIALADTSQGFYVVEMDAPLAPGETVTVSWQAHRQVRGFARLHTESLLIENGSYINNANFMPIPGIDKNRFILEPAARARQGLPPRVRKAALGDPEYLDELTGGSGIDSRATLHAVIGTAPDQVAVIPGRLVREWHENGRRWFEYVVEQPVWPAFSVNSARYLVASRQWNGVDLAIYYHPAHEQSVNAMLNTAQLAMAYFNGLWGEYQFPWFRVVEYARYRNSANPFPGTVPYSENIGFITDLSALDNIDYGVIHELAHMWWGHKFIGANMQGRQFMNEGMAEYATYRFLRHHFGDALARRQVRDTSEAYLQSRKGEGIAEQPVMYTEDQANISYGKGMLVMHTLTDILGEARIDTALRNLMDRFGMQGPPFPTTRDFVGALREVAGPENQALITDLFEKIVLVEVALLETDIRPAGNEYDVSISYSARKFEADAQGVETEVPLDLDMNVGIFAGDKDTIIDQAPLYLQKHRIRTGEHTLTVRVKERPAAAGINPYRLFIDRSPDNNVANL